MADYIKREDAIQTIQYYINEKMRTYPRRKTRLLAVRLDLCANFITIPAANVRENVRGHWVVDEKENPNGVDWCHCSVCGCKDITQNISSINYCHNCGADMRGAKDA